MSDKNVSMRTKVTKVLEKKKNPQYFDTIWTQWIQLFNTKPM